MWGVEDIVLVEAHRGIWRTCYFTAFWEDEVDKVRAGEDDVSVG